MLVLHKSPWLNIQDLCKLFVIISLPLLGLLQLRSGPQTAPFSGPDPVVPNCPQDAHLLPSVNPGTEPHAAGVCADVTGSKGCD